MARALRAVGSAALATLLTAALQLGAISAQADETDPGESETQTTEQTADDSTEKAASDATETTPSAAKTVPPKPAKKISRPFKPTEKIEAESVISFPANI